MQAKEQRPQGRTAGLTFEFGALYPSPLRLTRASMGLICWQRRYQRTNIRTKGLALRYCSPTSALCRQQRQSLMDRLQVLRQKICVSAGHFQRAVSEHLLEMEHAPTFPQIVNGEGVPKCVESSLRRGDA